MMTCVSYSGDILISGDFVQCIFLVLLNVRFLELFSYDHERIDKLIASSYTLCFVKYFF